MTELNNNSREERAILQYNKDIENLDGYIYTGTAKRKSMDIFNRRATMAIQGLVNLSGKSVIDIGCGDGTFTVELVKAMGAASAVGVEPSDAWKLGQSKFSYLEPTVKIRHGNAYELEYPDKHFDVSIMRGVLHHLNDPLKALKEMSRVSCAVFLLEPNGYNPIIKLIEVLSTYHRAHGEKSYAPAKLRHWLKSMGGDFCGESYSNLVPLFCPDRMATFLDWLTPKWESLPILPTFSCGLYCVNYSFFEKG